MRVLMADSSVLRDDVGVIGARRAQLRKKCDVVAMRASAGGVAILLALACSSARLGGPDGSSGVTLPASFAEGKNQARAAERDAGTSPEGGVEAEREKLEARRRAGSLPDPEPLVMDRYWEYEVVYDRGRVSVASVRPLRYAKPVATPRYVGRFAIELWIGRELVDRVKFDFPVIAADDVRTESRRPLAEPPSLAAGARVDRRILVPASARATRAELVDRATGSRDTLPWPPDRPLPTARGALTAKERAVLRGETRPSSDGGVAEGGAPQGSAPR
jgi:hypothetical protein